MEQMREKYESLSAFVLKDLAKARGIKGNRALQVPQKENGNCLFY